MKSCTVFVLLWLLPGLSVAESAPSAAPDEGLQFSLLPRAFQGNPLLDQTVITEMTDEGRRLTPASPTHPVYYLAKSAGQRALGAGPEDNRPPAEEEVASSLRLALAANSYLPASKDHPPSLLMVYFWGAHTNLDEGSPEIDDSGTADIEHRNLLSRAALVGGAKFAAELRAALRQQDAEIVAQQGAARSMAQLGEQMEFGSMLIDHGALRQFTDRNAKTQALWNACGERYYVIASAYDYAEALHGRRRLLWRTKMTIDAQSVSMRETLPGLIASSAPYLGVDMTEAATMNRRLHGEANVRLGPLEVREYSEPPPAPPAGKAKP